ncbi:MAG: hypothetical protein JOY91_09880, partial [Sinobacteraceae bacterium]|nr:hypothetical protein [Nevskiaceae bacterium]
MSELVLRQPDDWHLHLRDGEAMHAVLPHSALRFGRAIVMPNLRPPVINTAQALLYQQRIMAALPAGVRFQPLMTLYLTDHTAPAEVQRARESGCVHGFKLY